MKSYEPASSAGAKNDSCIGVITGGVAGTTYTVKYTTAGICPNSSTDTVKVNPQDDASFDFDDYCFGESNGPTNVATAGGTFSFDPAPGDGASIDPNTGVITGGVAGTTYTVKYTTNGICPNSSTDTVTVYSTPPCDITGPTDVCLQTPDGSGYVYEYDGDATGLSLSWSISSGDATIPGSTTGTAVEVFPTSTAGYTVKLTVMDDTTKCVSMCTYDVTVYIERNSPTDPEALEPKNLSMSKTKDFSKYLLRIIRCFFNVTHGTEVYSIFLPIFLSILAVKLNLFHFLNL